MCSDEDCDFCDNSCCPLYIKVLICAVLLFVDYAVSLIGMIIWTVWAFSNKLELYFYHLYYIDNPSLNFRFKRDFNLSKSVYGYFCYLAHIFSIIVDSVVHWNLPGKACC